MICLCLYNLLAELKILAKLEVYPHTSHVPGPPREAQLLESFLSSPYPSQKGMHQGSLTPEWILGDGQGVAGGGSWELPSALCVEDWLGNPRVSMLFLTQPLTPGVICTWSLDPTGSLIKNLSTWASIFPQNYLPWRVRMTFEETVSSKYVSNSEADSF